MGQVMLESCEMQCQKIGVNTKIRNKSEIYFSNMGAQLPEFNHNQSQNLMKSKASLHRNNQFLLQIKSVPSHYIEFVNYLFLDKKKFQDHIFTASPSSLIWGGDQTQNDWARISDMNQQIARIYKGIGNSSKSHIIQVLQLMEQNLSGCLQAIKPIYISKVGLAICYLYINGNRQEVVVDDLIPTSHLRYYTNTNKWYFLVEKAFAKLLGNYALVQQFTLPQLFQEITGLPFEISKRKGQGWLNRDSIIQINDINNISSFKEVIQNEKVSYLQGGNQNSDIYNVRTIRGHQIRSLAFHNGPHQFSLYRFQVQKQQKVSIRVSFLNQKFENTSQNHLSTSTQMILYKQQGGSLKISQRDNYSLGNNLYLGCPFIIMNTGEYFLYVKRDHVKIKSTLVCYIGEGFKIKEILSKQTCKEILVKIKKYQKI